MIGSYANEIWSNTDAVVIFWIFDDEEAVIRFPVIVFIFVVVGRALPIKKLRLRVAVGVAFDFLVNFDLRLVGRGIPGWRWECSTSAEILKVNRNCKG